MASSTKHSGKPKKYIKYKHAKIFMVILTYLFCILYCINSKFENFWKTAHREQLDFHYRLLRIVSKSSSSETSSEELSRSSLMNDFNSSTFILYFHSSRNVRK